MPLHVIGNLIGGSAELKKLAAGTRRVQDLHKLYLRSAPRELAVSSRVKTLKAGTLVVTADNSAVAAKLRQLAPTLLASIQKNDREVTGIRIEVQVGAGARAPIRQSRKNALGPDAVQAFDALAGRIPEGPLKAALKTLVKRRAARSGSGG